MAQHDCYTGIVGEGSQDAQVMMIGHAPGPDEWKRTRRPMTGPSGRLMDAVLEYVGLKREDVWVSNLLCHPSGKPTAKELEECLPRLLEEIEAVRPKVIVALGDPVAEFFVEEMSTHKFSEIRGGGWWSSDFNCWIIPTYHTAAFLYADSKVDIADCVRDFKKIAWYLDKPKTLSQIDYDVATTQEGTQRFIEHAASHVGDVVAVDIETTYNKKDRKLLAVGFACEHGIYHIPTAQISNTDFTPLRGRAVRWAYHGGMFDSPQLRDLAGISMPICEDTLLQSYSLDERGGKIAEESAGGDEHGVGIHGLKKISREYQAAGFYEERAKGRIDQLTPEEMAYYNSCDVGYTYRNQRKFEKDQIADNVRDMYLNILIPAANVHAQVTARGVQINRRALNQLKLEWIPQWLALEKSLHAQVKAVGWDGKDKKGRAKTINFRSNPDMQHLVYDLMDAPTFGKELRANVRTSRRQETEVNRTTNAAVLKMFAQGLPEGKVIPELQRFASDLLTLRGLNKDIGTYITGIEDDMDEQDLIRPEPDMHGTRVGRLAYKKPPVMTIPKPRTVGAERARIRTIFKPRNSETHVVMEADFSQAELWNSYFVSLDPNMLADLQTGDFHAAGAQGAFNVRKEDLDPVEWENYRDSYKIIAYGSLYGAKAGALTGSEANEGKNPSGVYHLLRTARDAQKVLDKFNARYARLSAWREAEKKKAVYEGEQANLNGRKRRYYLIRGGSQQLNQSINFPISSLSHDHIMVGWTDLGGWDWSKPAQEQHEVVSKLAPYDSYMWWEVHDSVVMEVSKAHLREVAELVRATLGKARFGLPCGVPVDIKVGEDWLNLMSVEKYLAIQEAAQTPVA